MIYTQQPTHTTNIGLQLPRARTLNNSSSASVQRVRAPRVCCKFANPLAGQSNDAVRNVVHEMAGSSRDDVQEMHTSQARHPHSTHLAFFACVRSIAL